VFFQRSAEPKKLKIETKMTTKAMEKECVVCGQEIEPTQVDDKGKLKGVCERCDKFTDKTNRSFGQTKMLLQLAEGDWGKLKQLEMQLKNCFCFYCPADKEELEKVLKMKQKSSYFNFE